MRALRTPLALAGGMLMLGVALMGLRFPEASPASAITNCATNEADLTAEEQAMLAGINAERAAVGAPALKASPSLNQAAAWKSADSSASGPGFSHTDSLGRTPSMRVRDCGYPSWVGENVAYGYPSAAATLAAWMGSPGHRANILNASYRVIGIGQHEWAWTTDFGSFDDSGGPSAPPPQSSPTSVVPPTATPTTVSQAYPAAGVHIDLAAGINLVTYAGPDQPVPLAIASLGDRVRAVYEWNPDSGHWEKFVPWGPAYVNTFTRMRYGRVYSIELTGAGTWVY